MPINKRYSPTWFCPPKNRPAKGTSPENVHSDGSSTTQIPGRAETLIAIASVYLDFGPGGERKANRLCRCRVGARHSGPLITLKIVTANVASSRLDFFETYGLAICFRCVRKILGTDVLGIFSPAQGRGSPEDPESVIQEFCLFCLFCISLASIRVCAQQREQHQPVPGLTNKNPGE